MNLEEFEQQYRNHLDILGNQLQSVTLELLQIQTKVQEMGNSLTNLTEVVDEFIQVQKEKQHPTN